MANLYIMEIYELVVKVDYYEVRRPGVRRTLRFGTILGAFAYAQLAMTEERGEMLVHGNGIEEHVPLYRMTV